MQPGFNHLGYAELVAVGLAVVIIVDWAVQRYAPRPGSRGRR